MGRLGAAFLAGAALALAFSAGAAPPAAPPEIGFAGLLSPDLAVGEVALVEREIDASLARVVPRPRLRAATAAAIAADPELTSRREKARAAEEAGSRALANVDLAGARKQFDRALGLRAGAVARAAPAEFVRLVEQRARLAFAMRQTDRLAEELAREIPYQAEKSLDARAFAPDVLETYSRALGSASVPAPDSTELATLARAAGLKVVVVGDVRRKDGGLFVRLFAGSDRREVGPLPKDDLAPALDRALGALLEPVLGPRPATLTVKAKPWVEVWIDGKRIAEETPVRAVSVPSGDHVLSFQNPLLSWKREQKVTLQPSAVTEVFVDVRADQITVR